MSEMKIERFLSAIRGSLVGGAIGDALGYPVEFMDWKRIQKVYGPNGIQKYVLDYEEGAALISFTKDGFHRVAGLCKRLYCNVDELAARDPCSDVAR